MGLVDSVSYHYKFDEVSGNAVANVGGQDLTDNNTVTNAAALISSYARSRLFTAANSEYFSHADAALFTIGDTVWAQRLMLRFASFDAVANVILGKWAITQLEYLLEYDASTGTITFYVSQDGTSVTASVQWSASLSINTTYDLFVYHDPVGNLIGIELDGGTRVTAAISGGVRDGTAAFRVGLNGFDTLPFDGSMQELTQWSGYIPTTTERTTIMRIAGVPQAYPYLTAPDISYTTPQNLRVGNVVDLTPANAGGAVVTWAASAPTVTALAALGLTFNTGNGHIAGTISSYGMGTVITGTGITATNATGTDSPPDITFNIPQPGSLLTCTILQNDRDQVKHVFAGPWGAVFTPNTAKNPTLSVRSLGYTAGSAGTRTRTLTTVYRSASVVSEDLEVISDLSEPVFSTCDQTTTTVAAGWIADEAAHSSLSGSAFTTTNSSTQAAPQMKCGWGCQERQRLDVALNIHVVIQGKRFAPDRVKFTILRNGGASSVVNVDAETLNATTNTLGWCCPLDPANYTAADVITVTATVYPSIGTSSTTAATTLYVLLPAQTPYYVDSVGGNDANTGLSTGQSMKRFAACVKKSFTDTADMSLVEINLMPGAYVFDREATEGTTLHTASTIPCVIQPYNGAAVTTCPFTARGSDSDYYGPRIDWVYLKAKFIWPAIPQSYATAQGVLIVDAACVFDMLDRSQDRDPFANAALWAVLYSLGGTVQNSKNGWGSFQLLRRSRAQTIGSLAFIAQSGAVWQDVVADDVDQNLGPPGSHGDVIFLQTDLDGFACDGLTVTNSPNCQGIALVATSGGANNNSIKNVSIRRVKSGTSTGNNNITCDGPVTNVDFEAVSSPASDMVLAIGAVSTMKMRSCIFRGVVFDEITIGDADVRLPGSALLKSHTITSAITDPPGFSMQSGGSTAALFNNTTALVPRGTLLAKLATPLVLLDANLAAFATPAPIGAVAAGASSGGGSGAFPGSAFQSSAFQTSAFQRSAFQ